MSTTEGTTMRDDIDDPTMTETCEECEERCRMSEKYSDGKCENCTEMCTCCDEKICVFADDIA